MDAIATLGSILGLSFICGINLYATVAVTGISVRYGLIEGLSPELAVFASDPVIFTAVILYIFEFFIDKIPGLDTLWDVLHTLIRPFGGALVALMQVGEASPVMEVIVFMLGGAMASTAHALKSGTRLLVNASPEPFSNIGLSLAEDIGTVGFTYLSLAYPKTAFFLTLVFVVLIAFLLPFIFRTLRMMMGAVFRRLKNFLGAPGGESADFPLYAADFFEDKKPADEKILWQGRGYAVRMPDVPKSAALHMVIGSRAIYFIFRRFFRTRIRQIPRTAVKGSAVYAGWLFSRWILKTDEGVFRINLYRSAGESLSRNLKDHGM
jgi:hypothetical protein